VVPRVVPRGKEKLPPVPEPPPVPPPVPPPGLLGLPGLASAAGRRLAGRQRGERQRGNASLGHLLSECERRKKSSST
jgi:hypothetical protein